MSYASDPTKDSDPKFEQLLHQRLAALTPTEKLKRCVDLIASMRAFLTSDIRRTYPTASEVEIKKRLAARTIGRELSVKLLKWDPEVEGY